MLQLDWLKVDRFGPGKNDKDLTIDCGGNILVRIRKRRYQRSLKLTVKQDGSVLLTCAISTPQRHIREFLYKHRGWIEQKVRDFKSEIESIPRKKFETGENFLIQGVPYKFRIDPIFSEARSRPKFILENQKLIMQRSKEDSSSIRRHLIEFYKTQGKAHLFKSVQFWSDKMQLYPTRISIRGQTSRWGSCSSKGNVNLNWKLYLSPPDCMEYVVVHELAHLRHQNHSKKFWQLVEQYFPDHIKARQWLKSNAMEFEFLNLKSPLY